MSIMKVDTLLQQEANRVHRLSLSLSVSAPPSPVSIIQWLLSQSMLVYSFSFSGFLASDLYPFKSHSSINQSWCNIFKYGGHPFCNRRDHRRIRIPKNIVSLFTQRNTQKHCQTVIYWTSNIINSALDSYRVRL